MCYNFDSSQVRWPRSLLQVHLQHREESSSVLHLRLLPDASGGLVGVPVSHRLPQRPRLGLRLGLHRPDRGGAPQARHRGGGVRRHVLLLRLQRLLVRLLPPELESRSKLSVTATTWSSSPAWGPATSTPASGRGTTTTRATGWTDATTRRPCRRRSTCGRRSSPSRLLTSGTRARR